MALDERVERVWRQRARAWRFAVGVALVACVATAAASLAEPHLQGWFARYLGPVSAPLCVAALGVIAVLIAPSLRRRRFWGAPRLQALFATAAFISVFGGVIIAIDHLAVGPTGMNAPLPWALLYYPAMGFVAQIALHLVPLSAIVWAFPAFSRQRPWAVMALSALPEAILQGLSAEGGAAALVALQLIGFGVTEAYLLRRFGFITMYAFRLGYYLIWHIVWAAVRSA